MIANSTQYVVQPYLQFNGRCEEALEFYRKNLGAKVEMLLRFKESPDQSMCAPGTSEKIMHSSFRVGESLLMASDGHCTGSTRFEGITLSLGVPATPEAEKVFAALSQGGQVQMPLSKTFFSPSFGIVTDKFGLNWMVLVTPPASK